MESVDSISFELGQHHLEALLEKEGTWIVTCVPFLEETQRLDFPEGTYCAGRTFLLPDKKKISFITPATDFKLEPQHTFFSVGFLGSTQEEIFRIAQWSTKKEL